MKERGVSRVKHCAQLKKKRQLAFFDYFNSQEYLIEAFFGNYYKGS